MLLFAEHTKSVCCSKTLVILIDNHQRMGILNQFEAEMNIILPRHLLWVDQLTSKRAKTPILKDWLESKYQALVVGGGVDGTGTWNFLDSVLTLLPGAAAWTSLASLPRSLLAARASVVGGRLRVTGGWHGNTPRKEVNDKIWLSIDVSKILFLCFKSRYLSTILTHGTNGYKLDNSKLSDSTTLLSPLDQKICPWSEVNSPPPRP